MDAIKNEIKNEIKDEIKKELTTVNGRLTKVETDTAGLKAEQTKATETQGYIKRDIQAKDEDCRRRFKSVFDRYENVALAVIQATNSCTGTKSAVSQSSCACSLRANA